MSRYLPTSCGTVVAVQSATAHVFPLPFWRELLSDLRSLQSSVAVVREDVRDLGPLGNSYRDWADDLEAAISAAEGPACLSTQQRAA